MTGPTTAAYQPHGSGAVGRLLAALASSSHPMGTCELARAADVPQNRVGDYMATAVIRGRVRRERRPDGRAFVYRLIAPALALAVLLLHGQSASGHSFYTGLRNDAGVPCCSDQDCRPVEGCLLDGRTQGAVIEGKCWAIPADKILPLPSPDGGMNGCYSLEHKTPDGPREPTFYCIILPGEADLIDGGFAG